MINFDKLKTEKTALSQQLSSQDLLKDREKYAQTAKRYAFLEKIVKLIDVREAYLKERDHLKGMIADPRESADLKELAHGELLTLETKIKGLEEDIESRLFEESEPDRDIVIEIRPAAGGDEAGLFASSLLKMYSRYSENNGWKVEMLSSSVTEIGGLKEAIVSIKGKGAYARLKYESGVHRVQRVPVTEAGGRIHTSTVTVAVLVEPKEVDLKLNPEDLKIDTYRSSGAGGQHVNVTDSAVRITHLPTNTVVSCQDERSQIKNREKAMRVIKARILARMQEEESRKMSQTRRTQIGTGERSEKIRTYNFPERRVTDHRINLTLYRLEQILEGDLDEVTHTLQREERQKLYEAKGLLT